VGAHVGAAYYRAERHDQDAFFGGYTDSSSPTDSGIIGGIQAGYNWQRRCTVFGFEIDASWGSQNADYRLYPSDPAENQFHNREMRWFGTARTRTGIIVDDVMLYVTGGLAWANVRDHVHYTGSSGTIVFDAYDNQTRWGWTAGVGSEWAFGGGWTFKSEVLYMQLRQRDFIVDYFGTPYQFKANDSAWIARVGINYIFGGAPAR
jgi:outer membrane immunogenic protein